MFTLALMAAIQIVSARIGHVTGHGLAANIKRAFPRPLLLAIVALLVIANTLNIAADFAAMADALALVASAARRMCMRSPSDSRPWCCRSSSAIPRTCVGSSG